ncbi:MAG: hypothetical protein BWY78_01440 [Alphaproteobacteria bacterium ADurb.Bin438]|nr:MAG: hypothetical protein BWY78_01440 [Alphaproteobacteria bacterium ADurb.Bin438]
MDTDEDLSGGHWVEDELDESGKVWLKISDYDELFKIPPISLFRQLKIRIYTKEKGQGFGIKRIEFSKIKIKKAK